MDIPDGLELLIIFGIIVLLFGAKKIPDLAKSLGKGIKNFKEEVKEIEEFGIEDPYLNLTSTEKLKLADKYCYSNQQKEAKKLLEDVIRNGNDKEVKQALEYKKDYCDGVFKTLWELTITLIRIKTGTDII
jgi:sec-independent protein translocase protein TatA